jgi:hypothetical protein
VIKAIETRWQGYRFRSRLEARWAVFFDALGVAWEYEPEGFDLGAAGLYLPDFWLPSLGAWFEVKPESIQYPGEAWRKAEALAERNPVIVAGGNIGNHECTLFCHDLTDDSGGGPNDFSAELAWSDHIGLCLIVETHRSDRVFCDPDLSTLRWAINPFGLKHLPQQPRIIRAISAARAARFEHGERP